jgi:hypothetical protein
VLDVLVSINCIVDQGMHDTGHVACYDSRGNRAAELKCANQDAPIEADA